MKLSAFQLKVIALMFMLAEHFGRQLGDRYLLPEWPQYLIMAGRIVAPIFFFLAVESYFKTSNRTKYIARLYGWAVFMQVGDYLMGWLVKSQFNPADFEPLRYNIFLAIAVGVSLVASIDYGRNHPGFRRIYAYVAALIFVLLCTMVEARFVTLGSFLIFYFLRGRGRPLYAAYAIFCILVGLIGADQRLNFAGVYYFQWMMIGALPFIMAYSGERGRYKLKYLFYAFYPLHVWALYFLRYALK